MDTILPDLDATRVAARTLVSELPVGALVLLDGPLGAGKTTFVSAMVEAIGGDVPVTSPTYGLVHERPTPQGTVVHADAYRLADPHELVGLGLDEYLDRARFVAVEWGGPLADTYPEAYRIVLRRDVANEQTRHLTVHRPVREGTS